jgi:hypothetical protein
VVLDLRDTITDSCASTARAPCYVVLPTESILMPNTASASCTDTTTRVYQRIACLPIFGFGYLYETLGLIRLSCLNRNVPWAKA